MDDDGPQCQRIIDWEQCGLEHGHGGDHLPYTPGEYLPPPLLHPLDALLLQRPRRCPACGARLDLLGYVTTEVTHVFRHFTDDGWGEPELEISWWFSPCGHEMREIAPPG